MFFINCFILFTFSLYVFSETIQISPDWKIGDQWMIFTKVKNPIVYAHESQKQLAKKGLYRNLYSSSLNDQLPNGARPYLVLFTVLEYKEDPSLYRLRVVQISNPQSVLKRLRMIDKSLQNLYFKNYEKYFYHGKKNKKQSYVDLLVKKSDYTPQKILNYYEQEEPLTSNILNPKLPLIPGFIFTYALPKLTERVEVKKYAELKYEENKNELNQRIELGLPYPFSAFERLAFPRYQLGTQWYPRLNLGKRTKNIDIDENSSKMGIFDYSQSKTTYRMKFYWELGSPWWAYFEGDDRQAWLLSVASK